MARPLWQTKRRIEAKYKQAIAALLTPTVNLYFAHKNDHAFIVAFGPYEYSLRKKANEEVLNKKEPTSIGRLYFWHV